MPASRAKKRAAARRRALLQQEKPIPAFQEVIEEQEVPEVLGCRKRSF